jgi:hypothetical protein
MFTAAAAVPAEAPAARGHSPEDFPGPRRRR